MTAGLTLDERRERAERRVQRFVERFEPGYYELVCHAALPLVLTPELVSYLRHQFLREVPWIAEVDLLLSDLCSQVGYELYAMDTDVRAYVLKQTSPTFTDERKRDVANLLISYVRYLANNAQLSDQELESQQWAAMVYLGPAEKEEVVTQIADRFQASMGRGEQVGSELLSPAEMARLAQVTETLREQLADYRELLEYASLVSDVQRSNQQLAAERVEKTYVVAPGKFLRLPSVMQQELRAKNRIRAGEADVVGVTEAVSFEGPQAPASKSPDVRDARAELPAFQTLEFVTAQIVDADAVPVTPDDSFWPELKQEMVTVAEVRLETDLQRGQRQIDQVKQQLQRLQEQYAALEERRLVAISLDDQLKLERSLGKISQEMNRLEEQLKVLEAGIRSTAIAETDSDELETFEFRTGRLEKREGGNLLTRLLPGRRQSVEWVVTRQRRQGRQWVEPLSDGLALEMVALPGGTFRMGAPRGEGNRQSYEGPQHEVTVPEFWLGKYAVTQAQWQFVVGLPQVNVEMPSDPSRFKGANRPVEKVSWYEAEEFCARLSVYTGRKYRLPSEAEWEYACRAGTQTPFHFGETLTTKIANYNGSYTYGDGPKGRHRKETTPVGSFDVANDFGIYAMHGNVWEWCADHWHGSYDNAPADGNPWLTKDSEANRVLRGGSWNSYPRLCRSASRYYNQPGNLNYYIGFRVSCSPPGSLQ